MTLQWFRVTSLFLASSIILSDSQRMCSLLSQGHEKHRVLSDALKIIHFLSWLYLLSPIYFLYRRLVINWVLM